MTTSHPRTAEDRLRMRADHWPQAVTPISQLMVRVYRLGGLVHDNATTQAASHGLTFTEFEILVTLRGLAPPHELLPTELYSAVLMSSGGLTKVLHGLDDRGLIIRAESETDRRSKPVRLTAKGRKLAERAMADVLESDRKLIMSGLTESDVERLTRLLQKLLVTLEAHA